MLSVDKNCPRLGGASTESFAKDTPRTKQRKEIRQRRLAYFERKQEEENAPGRNVSAQMPTVHRTHSQDKGETLDARKSREQDRGTNSKSLNSTQQMKKPGDDKKTSGSQTLGRRKNEGSNELLRKDKFDVTTLPNRSLPLERYQNPSTYIDKALYSNQSGNGKIAVPDRKQNPEAYWVGLDTDTTIPKKGSQRQSAKELLLSKKGLQKKAYHGDMDRTDNNNVLYTGRYETKSRKNTITAYEDNRGDETYRVEHEGNIRKRQVNSTFVDNKDSVQKGDNEREQNGGCFQSSQIKSSPQMDTPYGVLVEGSNEKVKSSTSNVRQKLEGSRIGSGDQAEDDLLLDIWGLKESDLSGKLDLGRLLWNPKDASGLKSSGKRQAELATEVADESEPIGLKLIASVEHGVQSKSGNTYVPHKSDLFDSSQTESQVEELGLKTHRPSARPISPLKVTTVFNKYARMEERQLDPEGNYLELENVMNKGEQTRENAEARGERSWDLGRKISFEEKRSPTSRVRTATSPPPRRKESTRDFIRRSWDKNDFLRHSPPPRVHQRKHSSHSKTSSSPERHLEAVRFYVEQKLRKSIEEEQVAREGSVTGEEESRTDFVARWVQSVDNSALPQTDSPRLGESKEESTAREVGKEDPELSPVSRTLKNLGVGHVKFGIKNPTVGHKEATKIDARNSAAIEEGETHSKETMSPLLSPVSRTLRKLGFGYLKGAQEGPTKRLLVKICPKCSEDNDLDAAWCTECGSALVGVADSSPTNHCLGDVTTPSNNTPGIKDLPVNDLENSERYKLFQGEANQVPSKGNGGNKFTIVPDSFHGIFKSGLSHTSHGHSNYTKSADSFYASHKEARDAALDRHLTGNLPTSSSSKINPTFTTDPTLPSDDLNDFFGQCPTVPSYRSHEKYPLLSQPTQLDTDTSTSKWDWQGSPPKRNEHTSKDITALKRTTVTQDYTAGTEDNAVQDLRRIQSSDKIIFERSRSIPEHSVFAEVDTKMLSSHHKQFPSREELRLTLDSDSSDEDKQKEKREPVWNTNGSNDVMNSRNVDARDNMVVENELQESQAFGGVEAWNKHPYRIKERHDVTKPGERTPPLLQQSKEPQFRKGKQKSQDASQGASYITQGYKRHWQRSSIAWDSYNPGELKTRSSVVKSGEKRKVAGAKQRTVGFDLSTESASSASGDSKPSRRRPASAGQRSTGAQGSSSGEKLVNVSGGQRPWSASRSSTVVREEDFLSIHRASFSQGKGAGSKPMMNYHLDNQTYAKILTMTPRGDSDESPWLFLPDELLLYILSFLSQPDLARVASSCQHFYRVAMDESLWRNITLTKRTDLSDEMLCYIGQHSPQILRLLQCTGSTVTERGLRDLFKGCKDSLKELNFSGCSGGALTGDLVLLHASSRCHNITSLDASWSNATNNGAMAVADISKRLEVLCVNGCQSITDEALNYVVNRHGSTLQVLEVFGCFNIKQQCLLGMAQNCPNLRVLNMGQCYKVTDKLIRQMASKLKSLEVWDLRGCKQVQDESVHQIVRCCSGLQTVTLANCPLVTDVALVEIATYLPNVRCVDVSGCRNVTDFGVRAFANNSKQLTYIDLSSTAITTKSVTLLGSYCSRTLETVKLSFCDITESAVVKLVKNCPRLHTLHVIGCKRIRNDGAIKVANNKVAVELGRK
ncbi:uncharacterized protein LOC144862285 isoform X1 [Branchiostoma floridae x Branchiostoma japonicum]